MSKVHLMDFVLVLGNPGALNQEAWLIPVKKRTLCKVGGGEVGSGSV